MLKITHILLKPNKVTYFSLHNPTILLVNISTASINLFYSFLSTSKFLKFIILNIHTFLYSNTNVKYILLFPYI